VAPGGCKNWCNDRTEEEPEDGACCDEEGLPAYLESSNPRNISLYRRFGFEAVGEIRVGNIPALVPMLREAQR